MSDKIEQGIQWMAAMMVSPNTRENRLAFVNWYEAFAGRVGIDRAAAAMDEASRRVEAERSGLCISQDGETYTIRDRDGLHRFDSKQDALRWLVDEKRPAHTEEGTG